MALNKHKLHHWLVVLRSIKVWQLLIIFVMLGALSIFLLRQNNLGMIELRDKVKAADASGTTIQESLVALQRYVSSYMNTSLGDGVFLNNSYVRDYQTQLQAAANASNPNAAAYAQIERECRPLRAQGGYIPYTQCAHDKLAALAPGADAFAAAQPPPVALYTYNFYSPLWSADLAGFVVLATFIIGLAVLLRVIGYFTLRILLRFRRS